MKKKLLPLALAAAAGLTGINTAQAVHVNAAGEGEVLIYPYFTVEGTQDTYISLVNTTGKTKAVKVRFLESMNSQEVLDFNLYLSPQDHWSAVITRSSDGGAQMITADTSCTGPNFVASDTKDVASNPVKFRDFLLAEDSVKGVERTREGYVEIIEMGEFDEDDGGVGAKMAAAALHNAGVPAKCSDLAAGFANGGEFDVAINAGFEATGQGGGLYGYGVIIDPAGGTAAAYDAVALDNFGLEANGALHAQPGDTDPSLSDVDTPADIINGATVLKGAAAPTRTIDAVSAVLMRSSIANDYVLESDLNAGTDWVVTFPTKRAYVNGATAVDPFLSTWSKTTSKSCEAVSFTYYDREELDQSPADLDVSPRPPAGAPISLCYEANVLSFNGSDALNASARTELNLELESGFENGWLSANFTNGTAGERDLVLTELQADGVTPTGDNITLEGLPVVGFAVQKYVNGAASAGVLANYAATVSHKGEQKITVATP